MLVWLRGLVNVVLDLTPFSTAPNLRVPLTFRAHHLTLTVPYHFLRLLEYHISDQPKSKVVTSANL